MRKVGLVPIKRAQWPASGSSHERLACTTRLAASHAAMCVQDFPATHIAAAPRVAGEHDSSHSSLAHH